MTDRGVKELEEILQFLMTPTGMIVAAAVIIILFLVSTYNRFVSLRNRVEEAFRAIDTYLEQRFDQLTKLADAIASYNEHERETFKDIAKIRSGYREMSRDEKVEASNTVDQLESRMRLQVERYPELKATDVYKDFTGAINDIEEKLSASRRSYNANVYKFNTKLGHFPTNLLGLMMGFRKAEMFKATEEKRDDVDLRDRLRGE